MKNINCSILKDIVKDCNRDIGFLIASICSIAEEGMRDTEDFDKMLLEINDIIYENYCTLPHYQYLQISTVVQCYASLVIEGASPDTAALDILKYVESN